MPTEHVPKVLVELTAPELERVLRSARTAKPAIGRWSGPEAAQAHAARKVHESAVAKLEAALASPQPQVEEEYRVALHDPIRDEDLWQRVDSAAEARRCLSVWESQGYTNVRPQSRTVTTLQDGTTVISPWIDLEEEGSQ